MAQKLGLMMMMMMMVITVCGVTGQSPCKIVAVFVFGDSIVDVGNNNNLSSPSIAKCNHIPYGIDYPGGVPTGRFTNRYVTSDFLAEHCGFCRPLAYLDPNANGTNLTCGVNYASGGAAILDELSRNLTPYNFTQQILWHRDVIQRLKALIGPAATASRLNNSLCLVQLGPNDITQRTFSRYAFFSDSMFTSTLVNTMKTKLEELYSLGFRKFIVNACPPVGCTPLAKTIVCLGMMMNNCNRSNCNEQANTIARALNDGLNSMLAALNNTYPDASFAFSYDSYNITLDAIGNPSKYGFNVVNEGCCGTGQYEVGDSCIGNVACPDRSKYLFFDAVHPGEDFIKLLAGRLYPLL